MVDDDEDSRDLLTAILSTRGFRVTCAASGEDCLRALEAADNKSVVVLTDVEMPGMGGLELCRELRARYQHVVAVVMSGRASSRAADQARDSGAFTFLAKPITVKTLEQVLRSALGAVVAHDDV